MNPINYLTGAPQTEGGEASAALLAPGLALHRMGAGVEVMAFFAHDTEHRHAHA